MKIKTNYVCEFCGAEYSNQKDAEKCEKHHHKVTSIIGPEYIQSCSESDNRSIYPEKIYVEFDDGSYIKYRRD